MIYKNSVIAVSVVAQSQPGQSISLMSKSILIDRRIVVIGGAIISKLYETLCGRDCKVAEFGIGMHFFVDRLIHISR
jgi:hypothetical protein